MATCLRQNRSQEAEVDVGNLWGVGRFKFVYKGSYLSGGRQGTECVCKFLKTPKSVEAQYFAAELSVVKEAMKLIETFNTADLINERISLNQPEIWRPEGILPGKMDPTGGKLCLVEPMILNFEKFNSNTGWTPLWNQDHQEFWIDAMQALSHFSYHCSSGTMLLCDLQGGATEEGFTLTDPIIMSMTKGTFGPSDLGAEGISTFFGRHRCNMFCNADWLLPPERRTYFACRRGSSMEIPGSRQSISYQSRNNYPQRRYYPGQYQGNQGFGSNNGHYQYRNQGFHMVVHQHQVPPPMSVGPSQSQAGFQAGSQASSRVSPVVDQGSVGSSPSDSSVGGMLQPHLHNGPASQAGMSATEDSDGWTQVALRSKNPAHLIRVRLAPFTAP